jgi:aspartyl-tRNA(Asn)/glutamyl-tRNA(Gln) amidotransferase subunit A
MPSTLRLFPTEHETIEGVGRALREGRTTCREVLERCLARIDEWEPRIRAWVVIDRDGAREEAGQLERELAAGVDRSQLHGIPVGIKDIIDVEAMPTACGSNAWRDRIAQQDANLVQHLRVAGAVILGKTVTTPYAWIDPPVTRNPWNPARTPGGSSSGSAAAVATGMCLGAIGTQTGGSVTRPASFCGVAACKPAPALISRRGVYPFAESLDQVGTFARSVFGARLLRGSLPTFGGGFQRDEVTSRYPPLFSKSLAIPERSAHRPPPRLLFLDGYFQTHAEHTMKDAMKHAMSVFRGAGADVSAITASLDFEEALAVHRIIMARECAIVHGDRFVSEPDDYPPRISALIREGLAISGAQYNRSKERQIELQKVFTASFGENDVLATPAAPGPAPGPETTGDPVMNSPWSLLGAPTSTIPVALSPDGLPLGIQLICPGLFEPTDAALWCEDVLRRSYESRSH